jgi:hypothetical protein
MDINQTAHSLRLGKFLDTLKASGFFMLLVLIAEALLKIGVLKSCKSTDSIEPMLVKSRLGATSRAAAAAHEKYLRHWISPSRTPAPAFTKRARACNRYLRFFVACAIFIKVGHREQDRRDAR